MRFVSSLSYWKLCFALLFKFARTFEQLCAKFVKMFKNVNCTFIRCLMDCVLPSSSRPSLGRHRVRLHQSGAEWIYFIQKLSKEFYESEWGRDFLSILFCCCFVKAVLCKCHFKMLPVDTGETGPLSSSPLQGKYENTSRLSLKHFVKSHVFVSVKKSA